MNPQLRADLNKWREFIRNFLVREVAPQIKETHSVLDIGIGDSTNTIRGFAPQLTTLDCRKDGHVDYRYDVTQPDLDKFVPEHDFVFLLEVLEHVKNPWLVPDNLKGIIKLNGTLVVSVPSFLFHHPMQPVCGDYWRFLPGHIPHLFNHYDVSQFSICEDRVGQPLGMCYILRAYESVR